MTEIIAITGGKGGTGKSTVATALAYELSKKNSVLLVDADVDCPNDHLILSIIREQIENVEQRIPIFDINKCSKCSKCGIVCKSQAIVSIKNKFPIFIPEQCNGCGSCKIVCPEGAINWSKKEIGEIFSGKKNNIDLLSGNLKIKEPISEFVVNKLNEKIESLKNKYDYIIIDTAAGTHCPVITAFKLAERIIAVTEPTPLGKHDLEIILQLLKKLRKNSKIIINRSTLGSHKQIKDISEKYNSQIIFEIPYSQKIAESYSKGEIIQIQKILEVLK